MKLRAIVVYLLPILVSSVIMFLLFVRAKENDIRYSQDFIRNESAVKIIKTGEIKLQDSSTYLAGIIGDRILFSSSKTPLILFETTDCKNVKQISINFKGGVMEGFHRILIDSPYFYLVNTQAPAIYRGTITDWTASLIYKEKVFFSSVVPVSENLLAFQMTTSKVATGSRKNTIGQFSANSNTVKILPKLVENQIDNYLSTQGTLGFSKALNRLVFLYSFRDEYFLLDTSFNKVSVGHTLDSISRANIHHYEGDNYLLVAPPTYVNKTSQVFEDRFFVLSNIMGNENRQKFDNSSVVDVYDLTKMKYLMSFYLPNIGNDNVKDFRVTSLGIIARYSATISFYHFVK